MIDWPTVEVHRGDMRAVLAERFEADTFHAGVTDPPYGLGFMGKGWDHGVPGADFWREYYRVLKPGAHLAAFSSPRTFHRLAVAIEDAGFEIRDCLLWLYGTGFPKGLDVAKAIDKRRHDRDDVLEVCRWIRERAAAVNVTNGEIDAAFGFNGMAGHWTSRGTQPAVPTLEQVPTLLAVLRTTDAEIPDRIRALLIELNGRKGEFGAAWHAREITGAVEEWADRQNYAMTSRDGLRRDRAHSPEAQQWEGWNTALKPAWEPILLARKPLPSGWSIAQNVMAHGTGAINIGACRIESDTPKAGGSGTPPLQFGGTNARPFHANAAGTGATFDRSQGRWPANLIVDPDAAAMIDAAAPDAGRAFGARNGTDRPAPFYADAGGASRFFYTVKASRDERDAGLEGWKKKPLHWSSGDANPGSFQSPGTDKTAANFHPTVKPLDLMRWVCRLVTPPGGRILDAFAGSGSTLCAATLEGFAADGIDLDTDDHGNPIGYCDIARARAEHWRGEAMRLAEGGAAPPADADATQVDMFG